MKIINYILPYKFFKQDQNNNNYIDLSGNNGLEFNRLLSIDIKKIIENNSNLKKNIFIHSGYKFDFEKLTDNLYLEEYNKYYDFCWLGFQLLHKGIHTSSSFNHIFKKKIYSNNNKEILLYVNVFEFDKKNKINEDIIEKSILLNPNVSTLKNNIVGRKNYLYSKLICPQKKKIDAVVISKKKFKSLNYKTKYIIKIINPFYNQIYSQYVNLCSFMNETNYYNRIKNAHIDMKNYIKNIELDNNLFEDNTKIYNYIKKIIYEINNNIATKKYLLNSFDYKAYKNTRIYRPNHGSLNMFRQSLFTIKLLQIFKKNNTKLFNNIFDHNLKIYLIILASYSVNIGRVGEGIKILFESKIKSIDESILQKIFDYKFIDKFNKNIGYTSHGIYSGIILKSILMKYYDKFDKKTINYIEKICFFLARYPNSENDYDIFGVKDLIINNFNELNKDYILCLIIWSGHYMDHCRGPWSDIMDENFMILLLNICKATQKDRENLMIFTKKRLINTQLNAEVNPNEKCVPNIENAYNDKKNKHIKYSKKCCSRIVKNGRYANKKFFKYSKKISDLFTKFKYKNEIDKLLNNI